MRCFNEDIKLLLVWQFEELADYLQALSSPIEPVKTQKVYQTPVDILVSIKGISKKNAQILLDKFGDISRIRQATQAELKSCTGIGTMKARNLMDFFASCPISHN
mmetsp:Transcript_8197/g.16135  ORF Transcript_8197/g.16135 Transcript_8197/m.16135 type:complete len:105 (-) Transcript_8197:1941-2255(-)